jgi:hypothetical protein
LIVVFSLDDSCRKTIINPQPCCSIVMPQGKPLAFIRSARYLSYS